MPVDLHKHLVPSVGFKSRYSPHAEGPSRKRGAFVVLQESALRSPETANAPAPLESAAGASCVREEAPASGPRRARRDRISEVLEGSGRLREEQ